MQVQVLWLGPWLFLYHITIVRFDRALAQYLSSNTFPAASRLLGRECLQCNITNQGQPSCLTCVYCSESHQMDIWCAIVSNIPLGPLKRTLPHSHFGQVWAAPIFVLVVVSPWGKRILCDSLGETFNKSSSGPPTGGMGIHPPV